MTNPALVDASRLIGRWNMEISEAAFLPRAEERLTGSVEIDWIENGTAIVMRQGIEVNLPDAVWIIGKDENEIQYDVHYADGRGVSRRYQMTLDGDEWQLSRVGSDFSQRFDAVISTDGQRILGSWKKSFDGGATWDHDFRVQYMKVEH